MSMSGGGKRSYEDLNSNLLMPSSKEKEDPIKANANAIPSEIITNLEGQIDSRPPKLLHVEHSNISQKQIEIDDPVVNNKSFALGVKGDGQVKACIEEKVSLVEKKMDSFEDKGESVALIDPLHHPSRIGSIDKTRRAPSSSINIDPSLYEAKIGYVEKTNQIPSISMSIDPSLHQTSRIGSIEKMSRIPPSNAATWKMENRENSRELWKEGRDDNNHGKKGDNKEFEKDGSLDLMQDGKNIVSENTTRINPWRRDQRFDDKDEMRESWKGHRESQGNRDSLQKGEKSSVEEEGELRDCEEIELQVQEEATKEDRGKEQERKTKDHNGEEREEKAKVKSCSLWEHDASNIIEKEKENKEKEAQDCGEKGVMYVKREAEEVEVSNKMASEVRNLKNNIKQDKKSSSKYVEVSMAVEMDEKDQSERDNEKTVVPGLLGLEENEKDKDLFTNHNGQQRKRIFRPKGHVAVGIDGQPHLPTKDSDGDQGNKGSSEITSIIYKPGECMTILLKLWREFESSKTGEVTSSSQGPTVEVRIPAKLVTTSNHQVKGSQLWGTDVYTDDSDLVAVLMHTGYYRPTASYPPPSVQELCATIQVLPARDSYGSALRNNVRSRAWGSASGCSYSVIRCQIVKVSGGHFDLQPCLTRTSAIAPTLAPVVMERTMTTRAASSNTHRQRFVQEVTIQYNLCNEPWMKYSMSIVADRGVKKSQYTSARLRKGEVLYLETHTKRYELSYDSEKVGCNRGHVTTTATSAPVFTGGDKNRDRDNDKTLYNRNGEKTQGRGLTNGYNDRWKAQSLNVDGFDHYKWAICKDPLPLKMMLAKGIPLPLEYIEVIESGLAWEEIQWSQASVWVRGKEYLLARAHFLSSQDK